VVMDSGEAIETGRFRELIARGKAGKLWRILNAGNEAVSSDGNRG
jgi:ABC-type multidrug transport system fused ATPase/permease subunit